LADLSIFFPEGRSLTACFCFCGTFLPQTANNGLKRIVIDNQQVAKPRFEALCKESTITEQSADKFSMISG